MAGGVPNFTPELERTAKALSSNADCLIVLLLSADEDDLYCMFFRDGKQLPWFKIAAASFDYLRRAERDGLDPPSEPLLVSA